jgi:tetratricopeptide (TPR) repeat protein
MMGSDRMTQLRQLHESDPGDTFVLFALAKEYEKREGWKEALSFYLKIVEIDPDYLGVYLHLGNLQHRLSFRKDALATYNQGIQLAEKQQDHKSLSELVEARDRIGDG